LESQVIQNVLGSSKPKGLNNIAEIGKDHRSLKEENLENLSFNNNYIIKELDISIR
jgi:hypothetical protein